MTVESFEQYLSHIDEPGRGGPEPAPPRAVPFVATPEDLARDLEADRQWLLTRIGAYPLRITQIARAALHRALAAESAIRVHRDQRGDDRCHLDDDALYSALPEGWTPRPLDTRVELERCRAYIASRHNPATVYVSPQRRIEQLEGALQRLLARALDPGARRLTPGDRAALAARAALDGTAPTPPDSCDPLPGISHLSSLLRDALDLDDGAHLEEAVALWCPLQRQAAYEWALNATLAEVGYASQRLAMPAHVAALVPPTAEVR